MDFHFPSIDVFSATTAKKPERKKNPTREKEREREGKNREKELFSTC
jgi:hypothetical protein